MKIRLATLLLASFSLFGLACDDSSGGGSDAGSLACDAGMIDLDAGMCSQPCAPGNELGVGKYCETSGDCAGKAAPICAALFKPGVSYCTRQCTTPGVNPTECGTDATCLCQAPGQCGCTPNYCF